MTQDHQRRRARRDAAFDPDGLPPEKGDELLSVEQAERVLRRAIEHQSEADLPSVSLDTGALERVAAEVGIERVHLTRALAEIRIVGDPAAPSLLDRVLVPERIVASAVVPRTLPQVEAAVDEWMSQHEGMRLRRRVPYGGVWERDTHLLTRLRVGLRLGRGSRTLRRARGVTHRVGRVADEEQVVAMEADTSRERALGIGLLGAGAAAALAGGAVAAVAGEPMAALGIGAGLAAYSTAVVLGLRMWGAKVRDALGRALDGIRHPDLADAGAGLPDQIDRLRRDLWGRRQRRL